MLGVGGLGFGGGGWGLGLGVGGLSEVWGLWFGAPGGRGFRLCERVLLGHIELQHQLLLLDNLVALHRQSKRNLKQKRGNITP